MPPNYTTENTSPNIVLGVVFDFGSRVISIPNGVGVVDSQWIIDHCRLAEESSVGVSRPAIVFGSGKITIDVDVNGNPVQTGVVAILNGWKIATTRTSGTFTVKDVYSADNSIPYIEPSPVPVRYQQTIGGTITQNTGSGGGVTLNQIENSAVLAKKADLLAMPAVIDLQLADNFTAVLSAIAALPSTATVTELKELIEEIHLLHGLKEGAPLTVTESQRIAGAIVQAIASNASQTTVTRQ